MRVETLLDLSPRKIIEIIRRYVYPTELQRVAKMNRYTPAMVKFLDKKIHIVDSVSYIGMIDEIFIKRNYEFKSPKESPKIIDVGANIGLSIIFFKQLYPKSIITAFEADPIIFRALEKNIASFNFEDVVLYERAAWKENTTLEFFSEGSWSGRIKKGLDDKSLIKVQTVRLRDFLNEEIDFLKLDVEGAETEILKDCADVIGNVKNIFVEYHHYYSEPQTLHDILKILAENGFDYHIKESFVAKHPFIERPKPAGMDFQVDILLVPIPLSLKETDEDLSISEPSIRWQRFGQDDHVRLYAKNDFRDRILHAGFTLREVTVDNYSKEIFYKTGIAFSSVLYIAIKQ